MKEPEQSSGKRNGFAATVIELLPNACYRVQLTDSGTEVIAHAGGAGTINFVRVRPRDRVLVELSPHDTRRGRIVKLLNKS